MTPESIIELFRQAAYMAVLLLSIIVVPGVAVGLVIAMFQAATSINEMSLSFVPKFVVTLTVLVLAAPLMMRLIINFTETLFTNIPSMLG